MSSPKIKEILRMCLIVFISLLPPTWVSCMGSSLARIYIWLSLPIAIIRLRWIKLISSSKRTKKSPTPSLKTESQCQTLFTRIISRFQAQRGTKTCWLQIDWVPMRAIKWNWCSQACRNSPNKQRVNQKNPPKQRLLSLWDLPRRNKVGLLTAMKSTLLPSKR